MSEKTKDNSIPAAVIGALIGGIFTIAAAVIGLYSYTQIEVPDVTGYSAGTAIQTLTENRLQYKIADDMEFDTNDTIIDQSIEPGTYVSKGTTLILTVNTEIPTCENHSAKEFASIDPIHPHYIWYICETCGEKYTLEETSKSKDCELCFPVSPPPGAEQPESTDYSVVISCTVIPECIQATDENVRITATTSHKATMVKLTIEPAVYDGEYSMYSDNQTDWTFKACFDTAGTYTVTAVAYFEKETAKTNPFFITYPF